MDLWPGMRKNPRYEAWIKFVINVKQSVINVKTFQIFWFVEFWFCIFEDVIHMYNATEYVYFDWPVGLEINICV